MSKQQSNIIYAGVATLAGMLLFPPFHNIFTKSGITINAGYAFILSPPIAAPAKFASEVNCVMLLTQVITVTIIIVLLAWRRAKDQSQHTQ